MKTHPLFIKNSSFSSKNCVIMSANMSFCVPVRRDFDNALSVCHNMCLF